MPGTPDPTPPVVTFTQQRRNRACANVKLSRIKAALGTIQSKTHIRFFPLPAQLRGYNSTYLRGDMRAGLNGALMAFPQGIAFAMIAGLPIEYGVFASATAGIAAGIFGSSRFITHGPSNATAVMLASALAAIGIYETSARAEVMPLFLLMLGLFLVIGACLRAANLIQYISRTVITGYITAASLMIIAGQLRHVLGVNYTEYQSTRATTFFKNIYFTLQQLPQLHYESCLLGILTFLVYYALKRLVPRWPVVALTLLILSLTNLALDTLVRVDPAHLELYRYWLPANVHRLDPILLSGWPVSIPQIHFDSVSRLANAAMAVAVMCVLEGSSIGKSLAARSGERFDSNQEMYSMGMVNVASSVFGGMPASGSLTRSQLAWSSGNRTSLSSLFNGLLVVVFIFFLGPYIGYVPQAVLAMLVITIGLSLFAPHAIQLSLRSTRADAAVFIATCGAGLLFPLDTAIYFGVGLSILLFLRKAASPELVEYAFNEGGELAQIDKNRTHRTIPEISIIHVEGDLFFGAAEIFRDQIRRVCEAEQLKVVIIKMRNARHLDATAVMAIEELVSYMREKNRTLLMSECRKGAIRVFKNSGLLKTLGRENVFPDNPQNPTLSTAKALQRARQILGTSKADIKIYVSPTKKSAKQKEEEKEQQEEEKETTELANNWYI